MNTFILCDMHSKFTLYEAIYRVIAKLFKFISKIFNFQSLQTNLKDLRIYIVIEL